MSNSTTSEMIDPSNFMSLDKAERETGLADISILFYSPEVLLDCTPMEPSYVWMGTGITDRDLRRMPILDCFSKNPEMSSLGDLVITASVNIALICCIT